MSDTSWKVPASETVSNCGGGGGGFSRFCARRIAANLNESKFKN